MAYDLRASTIHATLPRTKIRRFRVRDVPGARGWTGNDLHGNPIGTVQWVQGRCMFFLVSEGDLPFVKLGKDLGGWQIAGVIVNQTGQPFTVNSAFDINRDGNLTDRLNSTTGLSSGGDDRRIKLSLNPGVDPQSLLAADGADGSVGRNTFRANGIGDVDLSVTKVLKLNERYKFLLRTEIYNLFNRTHFAVPERILESPAFGASTRTTIPARMIQLLLRFDF